jgi:tetratricopeptide (TPR) repeat protein
VGLSRTEEGLEWFERGIRLGRELEPALRLTGRMVNMWAGTLRELGDLDGSRERSAEGLEMGRMASFPGAVVSAQIDLLFTNIAEGDVGGAAAAVPELLEQVQATKGWHQWLWGGRLAAAQAEIALASGHAEEAVALAAEAIDKAGRQGRLKYQCRSRTLMGEALFRMGRFEEAAQAFSAATVQADRLGHAPSQWSALGGLSRALDHLGRDEEAAQALSDARATVERFAAGLQDERRTAFLASPSARLLSLVSMTD